MPSASQRRCQDLRISSVRGSRGVEPATRTESWSVRSRSASARAISGAFPPLETSEACSSATADAIAAGMSQAWRGSGRSCRLIASLSSMIPFAVRRLAGDDRDAQRLLQPRDADREPRPGGKVHHVEDQDDGPAEVQHLVDKVEVPLEVRRIDDAEDPVGLGRVRPAAEEHVARHGLVRGARGQRIGPGQVDDRDRLAVLRIERAHLLLHRDPGVVPDLLLQAGERVEERALAAVRVADDRVDGRPRRAGGLRGGVIAPSARR